MRVNISIPLERRKEKMAPKKESKKSQEKMNFHGRSISSSKSTPGINSPDIELPAFNPPVPNRAWTAMREELGRDVVNPDSVE